MSSTNGHVALRRELLNHLREGKLTLLQAGAFETVLMAAHYKNGVWRGSARALAAICGKGDVSERQARHLLEALEDARYIRRFVARGQRGNHPILIHKYEIKVGQVYKRVNAWSTTDWRHPVLEPRQVDGEVRGEVQGEVRAPIEVTTINQQPETPLSETKPVSDAEVVALPSVCQELAELLALRMKENDPGAKVPATPKAWAKWAVEADRLMRLDERAASEVRQVIEWCQRDSFWKGNILSMPKLREKFPQLVLRMKNGSGGRGNAAEQEERNQRVAVNG